MMNRAKWWLKTQRFDSPLFFLYDRRSRAFAFYPLGFIYSEGQASGTRFSKDPETFRARRQIQALWRLGGKRKESLQLRLWNLNSTSNSPVAPCRLSCQISPSQRDAKTSANVNKHLKTRTNGNDVVTYVISANQYLASTFSMQIFKFQRCSCKLSFLFRTAVRARWRACSQVI